MRLADHQFDHLADLFLEACGELNPDLALDILDTGSNGVYEAGQDHHDEP